MGWVLSWCLGSQGLGPWSWGLGLWSYGSSAQGLGTWIGTPVVRPLALVRALRGWAPGVCWGPRGGPLELWFGRSQGLGPWNYGSGAQGLGSWSWGRSPQGVGPGAGLGPGVRPRSYAGLGPWSYGSGAQGLGLGPWSWCCGSQG
uniref:Uncharacterized protein n=1 Tax=Gopherus evgoodei TaxID=1825980 RepID=A0A8C4WQS9_9SAUR